MTDLTSLRNRGVVLVARCDSHDETRDRPCPGTLRYGWGQTDAACDACLGRCGIAVATWDRVEHPHPRI